MDLGYTEFQELLRANARDYIERDFPVARHRELVERGETHDARSWEQLAQLGWLGLRVDERYGGSGGTWVDLVVLLEELGRGLLTTTILAQALAAHAIARFGSDAQRAALLPELASGRRIAAVAIAEQRGSYDLGGIACRAERANGGYVLNGTKLFVRAGNAATLLLVAARSGRRLGVFAVEPQSGGVAREPAPNIGDEDLARIELRDVRVPSSALLGGRTIGVEGLREVADVGALLECGYAAGIMSRDAEMTIGYVKDRVQFGRPLGSFQAVQHQVADQVTDVDCSRHLTYYAAWSLDERRPEAGVEIARAKAMTSEALRRVTRTGNQLHGGIGFSKEYDLHFYYQRAKNSELLFGGAAVHRERVAAALLD